MYSSKPCTRLKRQRISRAAATYDTCSVGVLTMIRPSIRNSFCSNNQICTFCRLCRNLKIRFCVEQHAHTICLLCPQSKHWHGPLTMGWVMILLTLGGMVADLCCTRAEGVQLLLRLAYWGGPDDVRQIRHTASGTTTDAHAHVLNWSCMTVGFKIGLCRNGNCHGT